MPKGRSLTSILPLPEGEAKKYRTFDKKTLTNILNFLNFQDEKIAVILKHKTYENLISAPATPLPSDGIHLDCIWSEPTQLNLRNYEFHEIQVRYRRSILSIRSDHLEITERGICLCLPDTCQEIRSRKFSRFQISGVHAKIIQNSICCPGQLSDFSPTSFRVDVEHPVGGDFQWISPSHPATVLLERDGELLFSSTCEILRQTHGRVRRSIVLAPLPQATHRFQAKKFRSHRLQLHPSPSLQFKHPITGKQVQRKIFDISGSGISLEEPEEESILLPGLIIPEMGVGFAGNWRMECRGQVVYRQSAVPPGTVRCGITFLDMPTCDHINLQTLLHQAENQNTYVGNRVDIDDLFEFFFRTGFIYAGKYNHLAQEKDRIKQVYSLLYTRNADISRHFIYQDNGEILGHMAMVRFYSRAWLIHHHAADRFASRQAGLSVLAQIGRSIRESQRLPSAKMDFVFAYFRPQNKFPRRVFGGVAHYYKDPKGCSIDKFSLIYPPETISSELPDGWSLVQSSSGDLLELASFYDQESGGLMIQALDFQSMDLGQQDISEEYEKLGLKRERFLFTLKYLNSCKAVISISNTDFGLNLSDLTNGLHIFLLETSIPKICFHHLINFSRKFFYGFDFPILINNQHYLETIDIQAEKEYHLWILNCKDLDPYFDFCQRLFNKT